MYIFAHTEIDLDAKTFDSPWIFNMWTLRRRAREKKPHYISLGLNMLEPNLGLSVNENLLLGLLLTLTGTS